MKIPRFVLAGSSSGVGKTLISCGLIIALKKKGYSVQPFKVGPDYIDPSYLSSVSHNSTRNLDVWLMGKKGILESFIQNSNADISLIEGVMGYFDGFSGDSNFSSTHHVASILKSPVVLVLDASKTARSIAATALGFIKFHKNSRISGIILNKLGSSKHANLCKQALEPLKIPILGFIPKDSDLSLKSRHLGLIPTKEINLQENKLKKIIEFIDIDKLIEISKKTENLVKVIPKKSVKVKTTISIALDNSFNFYYPDNIESLKREGAKIKFFSPTSDSSIPKCDGLYIGGGFPEIQGDQLTKNHIMKKQIKKFAENENPIYAECGGLMYLTDSIIYGKKKFKMIGLFNGETMMTKKIKLNYTKGSIRNGCVLSSKLRDFHGHEFHYSEIKSIPSDSRFAYDLSIGIGIKNQKDGLINYNSLASYGHLFFDVNFAKNFVKNCIKSSRR